MRLHSAFLSEILDPEAVHGLGDYFLKPFVKNVAIIETELDTENAKVSAEESIGAISEDEKTGGRFDIAIKFHNPDYLILIENKIDAGDQISQLQRYNNYAKKNYKDNYKILYLTVGGHNPSRLSLGNAKIPYRIITEKLISEGFSDNGGQVYKKLDDNLEMYFEYENSSPNFGFKAVKKFENKKQLKQLLESAGSSEFIKSNLDDSGMWLSFYFSYGNDRSIEVLYLAVKNVLEQLENGFKKISQSEA